MRGKIGQIPSLKCLIKSAEKAKTEHKRKHYGHHGSSGQALNFCLPSTFAWKPVVQARHFIFLRDDLDEKFSAPHFRNEQDERIAKGEISGMIINSNSNE